MTVYFSRFTAQPDKMLLSIAPDPTRALIGHEPLGGPSQRLRDDYLYLGRVSELPSPEKLGRCNLILFGDEALNPEFLESNLHNILLTDEPETYRALCNQVLRAFDAQMQLNNFSNELLALVLNGAKPQKILELGCQILGNPVLLLDPSLCLLGSAGVEQVANEPVMEHVLSTGTMPEEYLEEIMKERSDAPGEDKVLVIWEKDFLKHRLIAGRIVKGNRLLGYVKIFEYCHTFREFLDIEMLRLICQYLALCMEPPTGNQGENSEIESFLEDILEEKVTDREAIRSRLSLFGLELLPSKIAIIVEIDERFRNSDKLYLIKKTLHNLLNCRTILIYNNDLVVLYDKEVSESFFSNERVHALTTLMTVNSSKMAVSMPFAKLSDFRKRYDQALTCLHIANRLKSEERLLFYDNFKYFHLLMHFADISNLDDLIHPQVKKLAALDAQKGSHMVEDLFAYVNHHQDVTATAEFVHVHYNTLKYRIERIKEHTGLDFDDSETIFQIMVSDRAIELLKHLDDYGSAE